MKRYPSSLSHSSLSFRPSCSGSSISTFNLKGYNKIGQIIIFLNIFQVLQQSFRMRFSIATIALLAGIAVATPFPKQGHNDGAAGFVAAAQGAFDRNNPNGTPTNPGNPDDLNGDGVINIFEAGAQADRR
ncbi:hypothetical protein BGZ60DRAFT_524173 [Tricladium varicosporioides]|nr:hypothetical protein BGZ60DRAFT_524173 [Hymenoscyphus varicosporioides]